MRKAKRHIAADKARQIRAFARDLPRGGVASTHSFHTDVGNDRATLAMHVRLPPADDQGAPMGNQDSFPAGTRGGQACALVKRRSFSAPAVDWPGATPDWYAAGGWHDAITAVAVTPDGKRLVSGGWDASVRLWTLATGGLEYTRINQYSPTAFDSVTVVAVTADGQQIITGSNQGGVRLWDLASGELIGGKWNHYGFSVTAVASTVDGQRIISLGADPAIAVWDRLPGQREPVKPPVTWALALAITPDLRRGRVITEGTEGYADNSVQVWNLASGRLHRSLDGHTDRVLGAVVTPDGHHVVTGSRDTTCRVWDLSTGHLVHTLRGHTGDVRAIAVTPDGHRIISGSDDATLRVWDLASGTALATWADETDPITCCAVSQADPATLAYGTKAGHIVILTLT